MNVLGRRNFIRNAFAVTVTAAAALPFSRSVAAPFTPSAMAPKVMQDAIAAYRRLGPQITQRRLIGIADFSVGSSTPRFHLINMEDGSSTAMLVAHGRGSDPDHSGWVQSFSNEPGSNATSSGAYITGESYVGQHGLSRRLSGMDPENSEAEARAIVVHRAAYVSTAMIDQWGKIGRSQGCFAFSEDDIDQVLWRLPAGSLIYAGKA
jgi:hypothetical protein